MFRVLVLLVVLLVPLVWCAVPITVTASVRGKKYDVEASTVEEFTSKVENLAGLDAGQNSVLFRGKVLSPGDVLQDMGISSGDVLMVVKGKKQRPQVQLQDDSIDVDSPKENAAATMPTGGMPNFGGMPNLSQDEMNNAMQQIDKLLESDFVDEYFGDDDKLEQARLNMIKNIDQYEQMMPGFKDQAGDTIHDPLKWKEAMNKAKEQILLLKQQRGKSANSNKKEESVDDSIDEE